MNWAGLAVVTAMAMERLGERLAQYGQAARAWRS